MDNNLSVFSQNFECQKAFKQTFTQIIVNLFSLEYPKSKFKKKSTK